MESVVQPWSDWEIQLLMLLSFTIQMLLFFTGGLRRCSSNTLLRFYLWLTYLGADMVALYALGYLSRHQDVIIGGGTLREVHPLSFLWAPFLLMHLGGQDTITAFAIEDNKLWLRHLLNLGVQVALTLYVFWNSVDRHNLHILIPGIFVFVAGIIKYGERILALMHGDLKSIHGSIDNEDKQGFPKVDELEVGYFDLVSFVLHSAPGVRELFAGHTLHQMEKNHREVFTSKINEVHLPKLLEIELCLMYDDLYTKAMVLRTRKGIILRCVSQVSLGVAFVIFQVISNTKRYSGADVAVTYMLFAGGFLLEVCAVFTLLMSPWTWAWSKAKKCHGIDHISEFLLSSNIGWPEGRPLWSNFMGQYNFLSYVGCDQSRLSNISKKVLSDMARLVGVGEEGNSLWMSKLLDAKYVKVDKEIMQCVVYMIYNYSSYGPSSDELRWHNLGPLKKLLQNFGMSFGYGIVCFHIFTEVHLHKYSLDETTEVLVSVCRKLSNYMLYLLVRHPEMLPASGATEPILKFFLGNITNRSDINRDNILFLARSRLQIDEPTRSIDALKEIRDMWTMLLIYSAGKSKADTHAAQLSKGGELLTFAWLLMAHLQLGDVGEQFDFILARAPSGIIPLFPSTSVMLCHPRSPQPSPPEFRSQYGEPGIPDLFGKRLGQIECGWWRDSIPPYLARSPPIEKEGEGKKREEGKGKGEAEERKKEMSEEGEGKKREGEKRKGEAEEEEEEGDESPYNICLNPSCKQ